MHLSGICAYFQKAINNSAPTLAPTNTRVPIQTPSVPPLFAPTVATASPGANARYYDVWCGDQNLIADTTNTERNVTWGACSNRCTANAACNYFLWGVVTHQGVYPVNRCALFINCDTRTAYLDGDPYVYVTERVAERTPSPIVPSSIATQAQARSRIMSRAFAMDASCSCTGCLLQVLPMQAALVASLGQWDVCELADGQISGTARGGAVGPKQQSAYQCSIECRKAVTGESVCTRMSAFMPASLYIFPCAFFPSLTSPSESYPPSLLHCSLVRFFAPFLLYTVSCIPSASMCHAAPTLSPTQSPTTQSSTQMPVVGGAYWLLASSGEDCNMACSSYGGCVAGAFSGVLTSSAMQSILGSAGLSSSYCTIAQVGPKRSTGLRGLPRRLLAMQGSTTSPSNPVVDSTSSCYYGGECEHTNDQCSQRWAARVNPNDQVALGLVAQYRLHPAVSARAVAVCSPPHD